jgi:hypothetical protein
VGDWPRPTALAARRAGLRLRRGLPPNRVFPRERKAPKATPRRGRPSGRRERPAKACPSGIEPGGKGRTESLRWPAGQFHRGVMGSSPSRFGACRTARCRTRFSTIGRLGTRLVLPVRIGRPTRDLRLPTRRLRKRRLRNPPSGIAFWSFDRLVLRQRQQSRGAWVREPSRIQPARSPPPRDSVLLSRYHGEAA